MPNYQPVTRGGVLNPAYVVSQMEESNVQVMLMSDWTPIFKRAIMGKSMGVSLKREGSQWAVDTSTNSGRIPDLNSSLMFYNALGAATNGSDTIHVTQNRLLTEEPVYGDDQLTGTEENMTKGMSEMFINMESKAVSTKQGVMDTIRSYNVASDGSMRNVGIDASDLAGAKELMGTWWRQRANWEITFAAHEGYSRNITASAAAHGLGVTKRLNPNYWIAGETDFCTWDATSATYYTEVATKLRTQKAKGLNDATTQFNADLVDEVKLVISGKNIQPFMNAEGKSWYVWLLHSAQMYQLLQDERVQRALHSSYATKGLDNPVLAGGDLYYNGFCFRTADVAAPEVHFYADNDTIIFGPATGTYAGNNGVAASIHLYPNGTVPSNKDDGNTKASIVIGAQFMNAVQSVSPFLVRQSTDYRRKNSVGWMYFYGFNRRDYTPDPLSVAGAQAYCDHYGSLVVPTTSPTKARRG